MSENQVDVNMVLAVYKAKLSQEMEQNALLQAEVMKLREQVGEEEQPQVEPVQAAN